MFGLRRPLTKSLPSAEFDGVNAILCNSSLTEPSFWQSKVNKNGEIFYLELADSTETPVAASLGKDCLCCCSDCATDDTGYGTDTDLYASFRKLDEDLHSKQIDSVLTECSDLDDALQCGNFSESFNSATNYVSDISKAEGDIDNLFRTVHVSRELDMPVTDNTPLPTNINDYFSQNNHNSSPVHHSLHSVPPKVNEHVRQSRKPARPKHPPRGYTASVKKGTPICECADKVEKDSKHEFSVAVDLSSHEQVPETLRTVELCELVLGIVPGHFGSNQSNSSLGHRRRDRRVKVRAILPTGVTAKHTNILAGDCLVSINDQNVTWDNLATLLRVLLLQRQARLGLCRSSKRREGEGSMRRRSQSRSSRLVQLVAGSNSSPVSLEGLLQGQWEPFYGALYLSLEGISSDNMQAKEDIVYQFPHVDNKVIDARGVFITLAGTVQDTSQSTIRSTTLLLGDTQVHVVYHCEGHNLFVMSAPESRFSLFSLTSLVTDLIRLLQITHGSIEQAFSTSTNHNQLDCFFALLHQNQVLKEENRDPVSRESCNLSQSVKMLTLPNDIKLCSDKVLTDFEAADFGDMSDSYYGCRRSYSVLGTCLFYKDYLIANHLPCDDLVDVATYLRYHALLDLCSDQGFGQLVIWKEVHPTRHCQTVPEEQSFGYTEPLRARWFLLIVGYKHTILAVMLETGGCTAVSLGVSSPDPFLIDQARTVLMQLDSHGLTYHCHNGIVQPMCPLVTSPNLVLDRLTSRPSDLIPRSLKKLPMKDPVSSLVHSSFNENHGSLRRLQASRKDSLNSDNSSESSGESFFKFSRKGRLFPETADLLQDIHESKGEIVNANRKLTVGQENCLFHFQYYDNLDGVVVSSGPVTATDIQLNKDVYCNFTKCCQTIKNMFDAARRTREQLKREKERVIELNEDLTEIREEAVMFTTPAPANRRGPTLMYWVLGRCLSRSQKREVYVCFLESTPQTIIELAFKMALGYLPA